MNDNKTIQLFIAAALALAGIALLFLGACFAPQGEIHDTILVAFGEIATFAGSIIGIDYHYRKKADNPNNQSTRKPEDHDPNLNPHRP